MTLAILFLFAVMFAEAWALWVLRLEYKREIRKWVEHEERLLERIYGRLENCEKGNAR